jgi:hypothetical protein
MGLRGGQLNAAWIIAAAARLRIPSLSDPPLHNEQESRIFKTSVLCFPAANGAMCRG